MKKVFERFIISTLGWLVGKWSRREFAFFAAGVAAAKTVALGGQPLWPAMLTVIGTVAGLYTIPLLLAELLRFSKNEVVSTAATKLWSQII
jgi:hypothetical protein